MLFEVKFHLQVGVHVNNLGKATRQAIKQFVAENENFANKNSAKKESKIKVSSYFSETYAIKLNSCETVELAMSPSKDLVQPAKNSQFILNLQCYRGQIQ